jgi:hypothetical protein
MRRRDDLLEVVDDRVADVRFVMYDRLVIPLGALLGIALLLGIGVAGPFASLPSVLLALGAIPVCAVVVQRAARLPRSEPLWSAPSVLVILVVLMAVFAAGTIVAVQALEETGAIDQMSGGDKVRRYCYYGARSRAQLDGCLSHVTIFDVDTSFTNAANYARGDLDTCRRDAGQFCGDQ